MPSLRVISPDGSLRMLHFHGPELTVGGAPDNGLVLAGNGVSSHHCALVVQDGRVHVVDRGSTNGTFVNNVPTQQSDPLGEDDRIYVGQYLLQLVEDGGWARPVTAPHGALFAHMGPQAASERLLAPREDRAWRDVHRRLQRHAEQWVREGRADRLALRPHELRETRAWLSKAPPGRQDEVEPTLRELIAASADANRRRATRRTAAFVGGVVAIGALVTTAVLAWPEDTVVSAEPTEVADGDTPMTQPLDVSEGSEPASVEASTPDEEHVTNEERLVHVVIPEESLEDIAHRYDVGVSQIAQWNLLNPDQERLPPGTRVMIERPHRRPLPQQKIRYELEPEDASWHALSKRFGVSVTKLRAYNPGVSKLRRGQEIVIWIDPHPYAPREPRIAISDYVLTTSAESVGHPNAGSLENGLQLPESPLYIRRYSNIMWGSGYLVANVQKAVQAFRNDMDFDGTLVLADISKKHGGRFSPPHGSHQSGRDIDIWLPTLRGVFKPKYLTKEGDEEFGRRPNPEEVDWFATWGLIRALIATGAVQDIFLTYSIQSHVYDAAKLLGASDDELDVALQWPRHERSAKGIVMHESGHTHHMHVRFGCGPHEKRCKRYPTNDRPEF